MMGRAVLVSLIVLLATATITARADELPEIEPGTAYALDGETLMRGEQEVGLFGIDAPEIEDMPLGPQARRALDHMLAGRRIDCAPKNKDRYGRIVAVCSVGAQDIGRLMVRQGWAITDRRFTRDYDLEERAAAAAGRGLWGRGSVGAWQQHPLVVVAIIGFIGVIGAQFANAWLTRRRDDRERRHETETLRAALIVELKINRDSLEKNVATSKKASETTGGFAPTAPMDDAYRAFTGRLGLLSPAEVHKVMFAYLSLRQYYANLFLIGVPPDTGDRHVNVPPTHFSLLTGMQDGLIGPIDEAIQAMESARDAG